MPTRRRILAATLAALGALGTTAGAYLDWFGDRPAHELPLERLYQSDIASGPASSYWNSMALPLAVVGALGVLGALLLSRFVLVLAWVIAVATLVTWAVMQTGDDAVDAGLGDVQVGFWVSAAASVVLLIGIVMMGRDRVRGPGPAEPRVDDPA